MTSDDRHTPAPLFNVTAGEPDLRAAAVWSAAEGLRSRDQVSSDADQLAASGDQRCSDADHASAIEQRKASRAAQARADAEQAAADRDQQAADYESNSGVQSARQVAAYDQARSIRREAEHGRRLVHADRIADELSASIREADRRHVSFTRERSQDDRDAVSTLRDEAALVPPPGSSTEVGSVALALERGASDSRNRAAAHRETAADGRRAAAQQRTEQLRTDGGRT